MILNGVMALTLRHFTEFGKPAFQHITASTPLCFALPLFSLFSCLSSGCDEERRPVAEFMHESVVLCSMCTMSSLKKFTFAISSADDLHRLSGWVRNSWSTRSTSSTCRSCPQQSERRTVRATSVSFLTAT